MPRAEGVAQRTAQRTARRDALRTWHECHLECHRSGGAILSVPRERPLTCSLSLFLLRRG
eukprot:1365983-Prymnesium_polylepis.1